jgi:hypothetical protein
MMPKKIDHPTAEVFVKINYTLGQAVPPDDDEFMLKINGEIRGGAPEDDAPDVRLGGMELYLVRVGNAIDEGPSLFEVFDLYQETMDVAHVIYSDSFLQFSTLVQRKFPDAGFAGDVLLLHRLTLDPLVQRQRLGLAVTYQAIRDWSSGCSLVVMKPFPLQFEANAKGSPTWQELGLGRFPSQKRAAFGKLVEYYRPLGFQPLGRSGFFAICPFNRMVTREALRLPESFTVPKGILARGDLSNQ